MFSGQIEEAQLFAVLTQQIENHKRQFDLLQYSYAFAVEYNGERIRLTFHRSRHDDTHFNQNPHWYVLAPMPTIGVIRSVFERCGFNCCLRLPDSEPDLVEMWHYTAPSVAEPSANSSTLN